jgi:hypothetical protein
MLYFFTCSNQYDEGYYKTRVIRIKLNIHVLIQWCLAIVVYL